jgi:hypothetical protein
MNDNAFNNFAKMHGIPSKVEVLALLNQKLYDPQIVNIIPIFYALYVFFFWFYLQLFYVNLYSF